MLSRVLNTPLEPNIHKSLMSCAQYLMNLPIGNKSTGNLKSRKDSEKTFVKEAISIKLADPDIVKTSKAFVFQFTSNLQLYVCFSGD